MTKKNPNGQNEHQDTCSQGKDTSRSPCCPGTPDRATPSCTCNGYTPPTVEIGDVTGTITFINRLDHFLTRWGVNRSGHRIEPGLYRLGNPTPDSPVVVTANYTLSFDAVRSALQGTDCYILVLDTKGINVWCAAGKGTFGTDELVHRISATGLESIVRHQTLVLPQLGAPGIAAHEVLRRSGFRVEYGPVRARDLPRYLATRTATPEMRRVIFPLRDRLVLTPIELVHAALPTLAAAILLYFLAGPLAALGAITAVLTGTVLFPALLHFIPTKDFSTKGLILGVIAAFPFALSFAVDPPSPSGVNIMAAIAALLLMPAVTAYLALNFTGSTPFTSRSGVKTEIFRYVPLMAVMAGSGSALALLLAILRLTGVI
jgi:hypothetical protein